MVLMSKLTDWCQQDNRGQGVLLVKKSGGGHKRRLAEHHPAEHGASISAPMKRAACTRTRPCVQASQSQHQQPLSQRSKNSITSSPSTLPSLLKSLGHAAAKFTVSV